MASRSEWPPRIYDLGSGRVWDIGALEVLVLAYLTAPPGARAVARRMLPGLERQARIWLGLRSADRRN